MTCSCDDVLPEKSLTSSVCIKDFSLLESLNAHDFERFKDIGMRKIFHEGEALFVQGGPINEVFVIKAGRIRLSKVLEDGTEITLDFRKPGDLIGEEAFSQRVNYPLTAWAMQETLTCGFRVHDFNQLIVDNPDLGLKLIGNMSKTILTLNSRLESLTIGHLEDRIFQVLSNIASEHGRKTSKGYSIGFPLTHEELGYLVGAHRVSVTKALKRLTHMGKIMKEDRSFILLEPLLRD